MGRRLTILSLVAIFSSSASHSLPLELAGDAALALPLKLTGAYCLVAICVSNMEEDSELESDPKFDLRFFSSNAIRTAISEGLAGVFALEGPVDLLAHC